MTDWTDREWDWKPGQHAHQHDTNGNRYRCPVDGCWWTGTGVQSTAAPTKRQKDGRDE